MPHSLRRKLRLNLRPEPDYSLEGRAGLESVARAVDSPLVRGGLIIVAGILTGNVLGFLRVALTAYLLGTHSAADALAVAIGPLDTLNQVLTSTMVFAFVPMLTERSGAERTALFLKLNQVFLRFFLVVTAVVLVAAPQVVRLLAPGLDPAYVDSAVTILRIASLSSAAAGVGAIHSALLYTDRRFAPSAFYQATLNVFTIAGALALWPVLGIYGFAIGYTAGAWAQFAVVRFAARSGLTTEALPQSQIHWQELVSKPVSILVYSAFIALNLTLTRAYATHLGPGTAAAFEYSMRCVGVPLAFLVSPMSNSLLPEIARLRSLARLREAFRIIVRTTALAGAAAVAACAIGIAVREPVIALLFERGSFTAESTKLVSAVFLGFVPSLIGWSLLEMTSRSLFALERPWLPVTASAIPVVINAIVFVAVPGLRPETLGLGASIGLFVSFVFLVMARRNTRRELCATSS
ncbi:MAG: murein biosynthesis integral membrane protein MurJ [Bryobacteraceae bacterium]